MTPQEQASRELDKVKAYDNEIKALKADKLNIQSVLYSIRTTKYGKSSGGGTADESDKIAGAIDKLTAIITKLTDRIDDRYKCIKQLQDNIEQLPYPYSVVLSQYHIQGKRLERIALNLHYNFQHVRRIHSRALRMYAQNFILDK